MPGRRLTEADFDRIVSMRERGLSYGLIAEEIGCSASAVSWHCLRLGADPPKPAPCWEGIRGPAVVQRNGHVVRRFTPDEDARLLELESQGLTPMEMARELGRRPNSVLGRLMTLARREERQDAQ